MSARVKKAVIPIRSVARLAVSAWRVATRRRMRSCRNSRSSKASTNMLNMLLPNRLPAARSGTPWFSELMPVSSSGSEVAPAMSSVPTNIPPSLVRTAIASPYLASCIAAKTSSAELPTKISQTIRPPDRGADAGGVHP